MNKSESISTLVIRLWKHIGGQRRRQFFMLLVLMLFASLTEILSIGAILPFLGVITDPAHVYEMQYMQPLIHILKASDPNQLLLPLTLAFGLAALVAGFTRLLLLWFGTRLSFMTGADLSADIYRRTLYQPYMIHCSRNSSEVIDGISGKANAVIYNVVNPILVIISSSIMLIAILATLLIIEPIIAMTAFCGFGSIYIAIVFVTRNKILSNSKCVARETTQVIKSLQEGLGGIRDVLIDGSQAVYCKVYSDADSSLRRAQGNSLFIGASPRFVVESLGMVLIALLAYSLAGDSNGMNKAIPVLGALALGAQRLLPVLQQSYGSWIQINGSRIALKDTLDLLEQPLPRNHAISTPALAFYDRIHLRNIGFRYSPGLPNVLNQINLSIKKGDRVGLIGATASGKSTLLDIIMGLLEPVVGCLEVDGQVVTSGNQRAWQKHIAHVPQSIFLADSTVEENIAFGVPAMEIDRARVLWAAQKAKISESIEAWEDGYQTYVGERGIRLSGGQRQRIGIARALYKSADVIVFDEATSALDGDTEESVMQAIRGLSKELTIIIVAHRLTTLRDCSYIVELSHGGISRIGSYKEIVG